MPCEGKCDLHGRCAEYVKPTKEQEKYRIAFLTRMSTPCRSPFFEWAEATRFLGCVRRFGQREVVSSILTSMCGVGTPALNAGQTEALNFTTTSLLEKKFKAEQNDGLQKDRIPLGY